MRTNSRDYAISSKENPEIEFKKFVKTLDYFNKEGNDIAKLK